MPLERLLEAERVALVLAHPDDETIGAGGLLEFLHDPTLIYVTDGAPRRLDDARAAGFATREEYAAARRDERDAALALLGCGPAVLDLGFVDQEAALYPAGLRDALARALEDCGAAVVLTHPYEGGHPDHDAAAFAVHAAARGLGLPVAEFTSYHAGPGGALVTGRFLGDEGEVFTLDPEALERKRRMLACYRTQQRTLAAFPVTADERFRWAPAYDFTRPPHEGMLWYERYEWGRRQPARSGWRTEVRRRLSTNPAFRISVKCLCRVGFSLRPTLVGPAGLAEASRRLKPTLHLGRLADFLTGRRGPGMLKPAPHRSAP